jgi:NADPH2:quinone reductase
MRVVEISSFGAPDVLKEATRPIPVAGTGEILIRVTAAGINRPDVLQRLGKYAPPPGATDIPGLEVAGEIVGGDLEHPDNTTRKFVIGQKVCALVAGGGYAEYCVAPIIQALPIPAGMSEVEAAGIPETFFTVWSNLFDRVRLTVPSQADHRKQRVLIHGGSSGIGVTAVQLVTAMGHEAIVTVGNEEKMNACKAIGAIHAINYKTSDFVEEVGKLTEGKGVDVVLDMVGGNYISRDLQCIAEDGRIAIIAVQGTLTCFL